MFKKLTIGLIMIGVITCMINASVYAANNTNDANVSEIIIGNTDNSSIEDINVSTNSNVNNTVNNTNVANNTVNNTNVVNNTNTNVTNRNNTNTNNTSKLPQTGINSSGIFVIAIFALSAVYAYKKIKDYNN